MNANNILTIGIDYRVVHGGVAAVENVYSTFYEPFNHIATVVDYGKGRKLATFLKAYVRFWWWMLFHREIQIVHVHGSKDASFWRKRIFINIAKLFGKKVVFHCHSGGFKVFTSKHKKTVAKMINKCDCLVVLGNSWKQWFEETFHHENIVVIKNVIAQPKVQKVKHDKFTLLFLGRLGKGKGIYDLLDVLATHREEFEGRLELLFGGDGEVKQVGEMIANNKLENIAHFQGWVSGDKKDILLNTADAYILPSYFEGLPISILEAMSYSLPIISTNVGGIPEILRNGENGFIMEPGDKQSIYKAIHIMMNDKRLCDSMGKSSLEKVKEHLPHFVGKQLQDLYVSLI